MIEGKDRSRRIETTVYGKWILAGEHAVLRGSPALVFPVFSRSLKLWYSDEGRGSQIEFLGAHGDEVRLLFWGVVERALELTGRTHRDVEGAFRIENSIPVGGGMGASAALCVAVGRWFQAQGWVEEAELAEFCRLLENLFHGESSGVDIAVAISGRGLHFVRDGERFEVVPKWQPNWYLSYSGKRGVTAECVARVKDLFARDPERGRSIDHDMRKAVEIAEAALAADHLDEGFALLITALNIGRSCFENWGLASGELGAHMQMLVAAGASAVKPTGSGDGGFVLSLWRNSPPAQLAPHLIPLQR